MTGTRAASPGRGRLVVIGTPIGNLGDLSPRAVEALGSADLLACEDTRRTGRLLAHAGVTAPPLIRLDDHTEAALAPSLVERVARGEVVAVVSDAGLPGLSDPGSRVVSAAHAAGVRVEVVPGPFAGVVAAVASGLLDGAGRFCFEGFLPRKGALRAGRLREVASERRPVVIYESPHRVAATLADLAEACGPDRAVAVCRELTKLHEDVRVTTVGVAAAEAAETEHRGEHVLVLAAAPPPPEVTDEELTAALEQEISAGSSRRDAAAAVARRFEVPPNRTKGLLADRFR